MGGELEKWWDSWFPKMLSKIPHLKELGTPSGMRLAVSHCFFQAWIGCQFNLLALAFCKWIAIGAILAFALVYMAERNEKKERRTDWITRGFGWFLSAVPAVLILILR